MGMPVVTVAAGGLPVVDVTAIAPLRGLCVTEAANGRGLAVTKVVGKPGLPVVYAAAVVLLDVSPPVFLSQQVVHNPEGTPLAFQLLASEPVTWSFPNSIYDRAKFELAGNVLRWAGNGVKDYENPDDVDLDNDYRVDVQATDLAGLVVVKTIIVLVDNVADPT